METPCVVDARMAGSTGAAIQIRRLRSARVDISAIAREQQAGAEATEPLKKTLRPHFGTRTTKDVAFSVRLTSRASAPEGS